MTTYDISHGGQVLSGRNASFGMLPSKEVGPYEHMEASAHNRPSTFMINRYLWWARLNPREPQASGSQALEQFLHDLRADGKDLAVGDKLNIITLPLNYMLDNVYVRVDNALAGFTFDLQVVDKDDAVVLPIAAAVDAGVAHLVYDSVTGTYTENTIQPFDVKALNGGLPLYFGHNHELQLVITALPPEGIDASQVRVVAEVKTPWLGAW